MRFACLLTVVLATAIASCAASRAPVPEPPKRPLAGKLYGNAEAGRVAMDRWCITCHRAHEPFADQPAPPLMQLVANADKSERAIRSFLMQPHSPMPPLEISNQTIEDIVAYLRSLKAR